MRYIIDHESYGEQTEFDSLEEAQKAIRACGDGFADVTLRDDGQWVFNECNDIVGEVVDN